MEIIRGIPEDYLSETAVCIGKFDGIHRGHQLLVDEVVGSEYQAVMMTFLFEGADGIYTRGEKQRLAESLGIDVYIEIPVTKDFFAITPENFIKNVLVDKLSAKTVVVGSDFRFGKDRAGDTETLAKCAKEYGYTLSVKDKLKSDGEDISSTRIRGLLSEGRVAEANELLGRQYSMSGEVESGNHIGRTIGVPTANLIPQPDKLLPKRGVYAVTVAIEGEDESYKGIANLGTKPTIAGDNEVGLEVNIFDYDGDIYGRKIEVFFTDFIREERKFDSVEELKAQIEKDIEYMKHGKLL